MNDQLPKWKDILLLAICILASMPLLYFGFFKMQFTEKTSTEAIVVFLAGIGVLLFPFVSVLRVGKWLELSREQVKTTENVERLRAETTGSVDRLREDTTGSVDRLREETKLLISNLSANINLARSTAESNVMVSLPERPDIEQKGVARYMESAGNVGEYQLDDHDLRLPLVRVRIELERQLERVYEEIVGDKALRNLPPTYLARWLEEQRHLLVGIAEAADYVLKVSDAVVHGLPVAEKVVSEAVEMGARVVDYLKGLPQPSQSKPTGG